MDESNNKIISKIKNHFPLIFIVNLSLIIVFFICLQPYYYRLVFDRSISDGNNKEVEALLDDTNFIQYATLEQGQKAIDVAIKTNRDNIDSKLALFDTASFKKFGNKELGRELSDSILETALKLDNATRFKLLEDSRFMVQAKKEQVNKVINSILVNISKDDSISRYKLLENDKKNFLELF